MAIAGASIRARASRGSSSPNFGPPRHKRAQPGKVWQPFMPSRYYRVQLAEIGYVRMIVESYDGLAVVRSLGGGRGEIEWLLGEGMEEEADELAARLRDEVGLCAIERPADWVDLEAGKVTG